MSTQYGEPQNPEPAETANPTAVEYKSGEQPKKPRTLRERLDDGEAFITNFEGDQAATWKFTAAVCGGDVSRVADNPGAEINLRYYYVHRIEMVNSKTGEINDCVRIAMVDQDGKVFTAVSDGVLNGLEIIRGIFGDGPWTGNVCCTVKQVQTGNRNRTYNLVPIV